MLQIHHHVLLQQRGQQDRLELGDVGHVSGSLYFLHREAQGRVLDGRSDGGLCLMKKKTKDEGLQLETSLVPDWDWGLYFPLFSLKERRGPSCSPPGSAWEWRTQTARTTSSLRTFCMASSSKISDPVRSVGRLDPTLEPPDPAPVFAVLVCFIFSVSTIWGNKD
ncbi:MICOS complex subunit MIC10 isoform X1 [Dendrobates tinctorius]|uniref:MICOS complex subunit MIC10 isoform X1 n=1 Tax=Dendrobates tinctorius TaxID=92724 RepID=UPI003CC9D50D